MPKVPEGYLTERRRQILAAASQVFSKRGIQGATMGEVADAAGISPGLIYRYFPSKEDLVVCAMSESMEDLEARWMEAPQDHPDPLGEFLDLSARTFSTLNDPSELLHTVMHLESMLTAVRERDPSALAEARDNYNGVVEKIHLRLEAAKQAGQVAESVDTLAIAQVCVDFYWGTRMRKMVDPKLDVMPAVKAFTRMMGCAFNPPPNA